MTYQELLEEGRACIGKGWWPLLDKYLPPIVELAPGCDAIIKEKFGTLRIRAFGAASDREKLFELERAAEEESVTICEECGAPGKHRSDLDWFQTLCESCYQKAIFNNISDENQ